MNKKQRLRNRQTSKDLHHTVRSIEGSKHICEECGESGFHFMSTGDSLEDIMNNREPNGFWTCSKFYGPDGRRIDPSDPPFPTDFNNFIGLALSSIANFKSSQQNNSL